MVDHDLMQAPPVVLTDVAREKLLEILDAQELRGRGALRVEIEGRNGPDFDYGMAIEEDPDVGPGDVVYTDAELSVLIPAASVSKLRGSTIDFVAQLMGGGFKINNPNVGWDDPVAQAVQKLIDGEINPGVASHGGRVELVDVSEGQVYLRMGGGCAGCGMVDATLRQGIEVLIKERVPEVVGVIDTTDHTAGTNPYYRR
ncbi:MAG: NifU family protein [Chloroflexota bacterium]